MISAKIFRCAAFPRLPWRKFISSWPWLAMLPLLLFCAMGCVRTVNPVLQDKQVMPVDKTFLGAWVNKDGTESADVQPAGDKEHQKYKVVYTNKDGHKGEFLARIGKIDNLMIAEYTLADPTHGASDVESPLILPLYSFLLIHQTQPQMIVSFMNEQWLKRYTRDHPDELQVASSDNDDSVVVTSSTADFQAFLIRHAKDKEAFSDQGIYVRPGDPTTRPAATQP